MVGMTNPLEILARHVVETEYQALPPSAVAATKTFVLDSIGVGVAGSRAPGADVLIDCAKGWGAGDDGTVWVRGARLPAPTAALINAYQIHALEFDCIHEGAVVHAMATALPVAMAHAERVGGVSGRELVTALALGIDVACVIGMAARSEMRFFRPATAGAFGATAALAKLRGFDVPRMMNAFGILYGQISGTMQAHVEGSMVLGLQMGFAARSAITAADLAAGGITGPHDVLTGKFGYFALFEPEADWPSAWRDLGSVWQITRLSHKPFPSGRLTHAVIGAIQSLRARREFGAEDVEQVTCRVPPLAMRLVGRACVASPDANYARLCLPFVAATTLLRGTVGLSDFSPERLADAELHALAAKVDVVLDDNADENALAPQTVEISLKDGSRDAVVVEHAPGHPDNPLSRDQQLDKFHQCWRSAAMDLGAAASEHIISNVDRLEDVADVRTLARFLVPEKEENARRV